MIEVANDAAREVDLIIAGTDSRDSITAATPVVVHCRARLYGRVEKVKLRELL